MYNTIKAKSQAIDILKNYSGINPYILKLKRDIILLSNTKLLTDYVTEYIILNHDVEPKPIGKTLQISDWFGERLKNEYNIEFTPSKVLIMTFLGATSVAYHCIIKYRQNMSPIDMFIPKKALLGDFLLEDYHKLNVDFDRFDRLSMAKDPKRKIKEHQKDAIKFLLSRKKCILADDMGVGKSLELSVAAVEGNFDSILIICPASLKSNWKKELMWYVPERDITIIESLNDKTKPELEKFLGYKEGMSNLKVADLRKEAYEKGKWEFNRFVIINYDILDEFYEIPLTRSKYNLEKSMENSPLLQFISNRKSLIIIDEAHRLSNKDSNRYKIIKNLIKRGNPDSLYLATGTPVTNNPQNLYCILQLLGDPITDDWEFYMNRYCGAMKIPAKGEKEKWTNFFLNKVHKNSWFELDNKEKSDLKEYINANARKITILKDATNLEELKLRVQHIYLRRTKEDISDGLPNKNVHELLYDFNSLQKSEYDRLWDEYEESQFELDPTKEINKDLLEGAIYRRYCSNQMVPNTLKLVDELIKNGDKVIVATCYDEELSMIKEHYGEKCIVYNGKMSSKEKDKAKDEFINNPDKLVFIGQIIAAGVGLTLTVSHIMVFNNIDFVPGNNRQMEDRIYRIGQKEDVDIYYQIFKNTQYEKMWNTVMRKELVINKIIKKEDEK